MDGHTLELDDNGFDLAGSQFGVMLFPDMPKGISEMVRVVKPGGRVLMVGYGDPREIDFFSFFVNAIQSVRPNFTGPPMDPPPLPFQLQDPERLRSELAAAGLKDIQVVTITEATGFRIGKKLWDWIVYSNPIVDMVLGELDLGNDEKDAALQAMEQLVRERAGGSNSAALSNPINIGIGIK